MRRISLQVAAAVLAAVMSNCALAQMCPQNFDGVTAPALPTGWTVTTDGAGAGWSTTTTNSQSPPNAAFAPDVGAVGSSYLNSPPTVIGDSTSTLTFRHYYNIENTFDGGVLEISIAGSAFQDILTAGGLFRSGGYTTTISSSFMSPIAGRQAWSGISAGYVTTVVELPATAFGKSTVLRWRIASDSSLGSPGWTVDSIDCNSVSAWRYANAPYPIPILDQAATAMGGKLYSFAGSSGAGVNVATSYRYDGVQWTQIGSLPVVLEVPVAVNDGTHIFILGGLASGGGVTATLYRYTPQTNTYETMAPMATAVWATGAVVVNGKIVKFGGLTDASSAITHATEIYDIATNTWSAGAAYPGGAVFVSAFTRNGYVYGAGGNDFGSSQPSSKTYRYDLVADVWDDAPIPDLPESRYGAATFDVPGGTVLAGGYVGGSVDGNISKTAILWDATANSWRSFPSLAAARARMTGAVLDGQPIVVGGRSRAGGFAGTDTVQVLDRIFADGFELPN